MTATYRLDRDVALITIENPPVNGLSLSVRQGICDALMLANSDAAVRAIVLKGSARGFSGGADVREFGEPDGDTEPTVWTLIEAVEASRKPVVAALHSICVGGALELALGCHYRIAAPGCMLAFPEVALGLIPGAGGTQRFPRAVGVETALNMILSGQSASSETLTTLPGQRLFDALSTSEEALEDAAVAFARQVSAMKSPGEHPLIRHLTNAYPTAAGYFQFVRNSLAPSTRKNPASAQCIDAVEDAVTRPFEEGLARERRAFRQLVDTPEARALRHAFLAERAAGHIRGVPEATPVRPLHSVAVVGGGTMGSGIALCLMDANYPVTLLETSEAMLRRAVDGIRRHYYVQLTKGRLSAAEIDRRLGLLQPTLAYGDLSDSDLVIEAAYEDMSVKEAVFKKLDAVMRSGAILASNTSTMDLDVIAAFTRRPQDVVGLHFFSPANVMRLLEVVRGARTAPDVLATVMSFAKRIRKTAVVSGVCDGFIGNRMFEEYSRQAGFLLDEGASPMQVDRAMEAFGMAMGPFAVYDLAGNDIGWAIRQRRGRDRPDIVYSDTADRLYALGRHGQKVCAGWYDYARCERTPMLSTAVEQMLVEHRQYIGISPREISDQEIVDRLVLALVNEGARILEEGIAARPGDIDVVYLAGYGFPASRGGPMNYASERGLYNVAASMRRLSAEARVDPGFWKPAVLIERLAANSEAFS